MDIKCTFCDMPLYVKVKRYTAPLAAPLTRADELRQALLNLTGEEYVQLDNIFCPICGRQIKDTVN